MHTKRNPLRALGLGRWLLCCALVGCESHRDDAQRAEDPPACRVDFPDAAVSTEVPDVWRVRRLTRNELAGSFLALVGMVPESLSRLPPDETDLGDDRARAVGLRGRSLPADG